MLLQYLRRASESQTRARGKAASRTSSCAEASSSAARATSASRSADASPRTGDDSRAQPGCRLDRGVRQVAGGVELEERVADEEATGVTGEDVPRRRTARMGRREALRRLDDGRVRREAVSGEQRGEEARRG